MKMKIKFHSDKELIKDIVNNAQFPRLLNLLQDNGKGCVDHRIFVEIGNLRTILFWDIYEYITRTEWDGDSMKNRIKKMRPKCFGKQNAKLVRDIIHTPCSPRRVGGRGIKCKFHKECHKKHSR